MAKGFKVSTITTRLAAVANAHRVAGFSLDRKVMVGPTLERILRQNGTAKNRARAIAIADIRAAAARSGRAANARL
jgi:hypothetical protein